MTDTRWGLLGAGWLVTQATGAAIHRASGATLLAAASRDVERAAATGAARAYDSYAAVIDDPDIDAVYICLNNDAHLPWITAAIDAGKHVLCEKPMVLSAADAQGAFASADAAGLILVEATWTRWHPRMRRIVDLVTSGGIGRVESYLGTFTFDGVPAGNYRMSAVHGGGALYDVGIYPLHGLVACLPDDEPVQVLDVDRGMGGAGVDLTTKASVAWGHGGQGSVVASFAMPASQRLVIRGSEGTLRIDDDQAWTSWRTRSELVIDDRVEDFPEVDAYQLMFENVSAAIRGEGGWTPPAEDSIRVARLVDEIRDFPESTPHR